MKYKIIILAILSILFTNQAWAKSEFNFDQLMELPHNATVEITQIDNLDTVDSKSSQLTVTISLKKFKRIYESALLYINLKNEPKYDPTPEEQFLIEQSSVLTDACQLCNSLFNDEDSEYQTYNDNSQEESKPGQDQAPDGADQEALLDAIVDWGKKHIKGSSDCVGCADPRFIGANNNSEIMAGSRKVASVQLTFNF